MINNEKMKNEKIRKWENGTIKKWKDEKKEKHRKKNNKFTDIKNGFLLFLSWFNITVVFMRIVIINIILCILRKSQTKYGAKYITRKQEKRNIRKEEK